MTKADERIARIEESIARLEALGMGGGPTPTPSSVNPDGSPGLVAAGELIESAWGNAVSNEFNRIRAGHKQLTTGASFGTTRTDFPGLFIDANFISNRLYRVTALVPNCTQTAAGWGSIYITDAAQTPLNLGMAPVPAANAVFSLYTSVILSNTAGPNTLKVQIAASAGQLNVVAGYSSFVVIEEISKRFTP